jgi:beta-N-acetylhexosaminidase
MRKTRLPLGPAVIDVVGPTLTDEDRNRLRHPAAGGVILFSPQLREPGTAVHPHDRNSTVA